MRFNILCMFLACFIQVCVTLEHGTLHIDEIRGFVTEWHMMIRLVLGLCSAN